MGGAGDQSRLTLARILKQAREEAGLTQQQLAERLTANGHAVSQTAVYKWENGLGGPRIRRLSAISVALGLESHALMERYLEATFNTHPGIWFFLSPPTVALISEYALLVYA